jgi:hypothetical protein
MKYQNKFCVSSVKFKPLSPVGNGELSEKTFRKCAFCEKECLVQPVSKNMSDRISGPDRFYCVSCLRRNHHTKNRRNVLILSFRAIIGHFYYTNYSFSASGRRMYLSDINDYVESHVKVGLMNPVFDYDPDTLLWFVDFSRVGDSKRRVPLEEVLKTIVDILTCFNLTQTVPGVSLSSVFDKYREAIQNFYEKRYRPQGRRMLIPTLAGCNAGDGKGQDRLRSFTPNEMFAKHENKY